VHTGHPPARTPARFNYGQARILEGCGERLPFMRARISPRQFFGLGRRGSDKRPVSDMDMMIEVDPEEQMSVRLWSEEVSGRPVPLVHRARRPCFDIDRD